MTTAKEAMTRRCDYLFATYGVGAVLVTTPQAARELDFADLPHKECEIGRGTLALDEFDAQGVLKRLAA